MLFLAGKEHGPFGEQSAFLPVQPGELAQGMYSPSCEVWAGCLPSHLFYCWPRNGETRLGWATFWPHLRLAFGVSLVRPARGPSGSELACSCLDHQADICPIVITGKLFNSVFCFYLECLILWSLIIFWDGNFSSSYPLSFSEITCLLI